MFLSLQWVFISVFVLLNLLQQIHCHDVNSVWRSYSSYAPSGFELKEPPIVAEKQTGNLFQSFSPGNNTESEETKKVNEDNIKALEEKLFHSYDNYPRHQREHNHGKKRFARDIRYGTGWNQGNRLNYSGNNWAPNLIGSFKEHERNSSYLIRNGMNNTWGNNNMTFGRNSTYPRRRQEGMFLNTTAPLRNSNYTFPNCINCATNLSQRNYTRHNYRITTNRTQLNRSNLSHPFSTRGIRYKRTIDNSKLINNELFPFIRGTDFHKINQKENEKSLERLKELTGNTMKKEKYIQQEGVPFLNYGNLPEVSVEDNSYKQGIINSHPLYNSNKLKEYEEKVETDFGESVENFSGKDDKQGNVSNREFSYFPGIINYLNEMSNTIDDSNNLLSDNKQLETFPTIHKLSNRRKLLENRKEDDNIGTIKPIFTTTPYYNQNIDSRFHITRILTRDEFDALIIKPILQMTTTLSAMINQPRQDAVLIQVPTRVQQIVCPPNTKLARGRCRTVW